MTDESQTTQCLTVFRERCSEPRRTRTKMYLAGNWGESRSRARERETHVTVQDSANEQTRDGETVADLLHEQSGGSESCE